MHRLTVFTVHGLIMLTVSETGESPITSCLLLFHANSGAQHRQLQWALPRLVL